MEVNTKSKDTGQIVIPQNTLVVLVGPAGCGKSTFAAKHFVPTQIVSSDQCRALVSDDVTNQGVSHHAFDLMNFLIKKRLLLGRLTVADAMNIDPVNRKRLVRFARWFRFRSLALVFKIPLETCLARNDARDRRVPKDVLLKQYKLFESARHTIGQEGFNDLFVLDETAQSETSIEIAPPYNHPVNRPPAQSARQQE